jgi:hypothetical protein
MHWLFYVLLAVCAYALVAGYIYVRKAAHERKKADRIAFPEQEGDASEGSFWDMFVFYGPILALKTERVAFSTGSPGFQHSSGSMPPSA